MVKKDAQQIIITSHEQASYQACSYQQNFQVSCKQVKRILITAGEPAGIGPDVVLQIAQRKWPVELVVIADPHLLKERAEQLNLNIQLKTVDLDLPPQRHLAGTLKILPVTLSTPVKVGELNAMNAHYVLETLRIAALLCLKEKAAALVTAPVHKGILNTAGVPFLGHTEFFADYSSVPLTLMLFVMNHLKVALATTHLPLAQVPQAITQSHLHAVIVLYHQELKAKFGLAHPRILVAGLNPHAGEGGHIGREEIDVIAPVIRECQAQGLCIEGPFSADTLFTPKVVGTGDAVLAMYHDQALPLVKYIGFGKAVNLTLGLPFVRTSVDHGTALDIAGTGQADPSSLSAAVKLAIQLTAG